jgi:hypothetical protein
LSQPLLHTAALYDVFHGKGCSKAFKLTLMRSVREAGAAVAAKGGDGSGTFIQEAMLSALAVVPDEVLDEPCGDSPTAAADVAG